jgi:hypothetical protein
MVLAKGEAKGRSMSSWMPENRHRELEEKWQNPQFRHLAHGGLRF